MTAIGKRIEQGTISIVERYCKYCGNNRAWSKPRGTFCTRCRRQHL